MSTAVLNVKVDEALKEKLRHYAEVHNENLSIATEKLLLIAFSAIEEVGVSAEAIDSQHTEELIAADIPAQTNVFHITGAQHFTGFAIITGG